ncbi:MAG: hypothetical protein M3P45_05815, partial [Acidobacteriota bacterium]|nr:hypothetical protein [Acidobacteriota bacterium]
SNARVGIAGITQIIISAKLFRTSKVRGLDEHDRCDGNSMVSSSNAGISSITIRQREKPRSPDPRHAFTPH